ncbi:hypothetical protein N9980_01995 [bacterium]|nr:hypothetical protein [bacterium]
MSDSIDRGKPFWRGADVEITDEPPPEQTEPGFYPDPRRVVSKNAASLAWLFIGLRDGFSGHLDGANKVEFFGRLAEAARAYQHQLGEKSESERDLLLAVLHEAFVMLEEMEAGEFRCLPVASGGTIWADLIDEAERSGYLGVDETRRFFEEMEKTHEGS